VIARLEWGTVSVTLPRLLHAGPLVIRAREYCCVRVTLGSGATGESFVLTRGLDVAGALEQLFAARALAGAAMDALRSDVRNLGWDGAISRAASALRLAALDAAAREKHAPVWRFLGGEAAPSAPAIAVIGYGSPGDATGAAETSQAEAAAAAGFGWIKLMGIGGTADDELARLRRIRNAVGDDVRIALDVNGAWSVADAHAALPRLADAGLFLLEEPWPYEQGLGGFNDLPSDRPQLAFGEVSASVIELEALAATGCVEHLRADATLVGAAEAWRALAPSVQATGVPLFPHYWPEVHRHLIPLAETSFLECTLASGGEFGLEQLVSPMAEMRDGRIAAPDEPGFGFSLDWERIGGDATRTLEAAAWAR